MEVGHQRVDDMKGASGIDENVGVAGKGTDITVAGRRLQRLAAPHGLGEALRGGAGAPPRLLLAQQLEGEVGPDLLEGLLLRGLAVLDLDDVEAVGGADQVAAGADLEIDLLPVPGIAALVVQAPPIGS